MKKFFLKLGKVKLGTTLFLTLLVTIWTIPTLGLIITSLRTKDEVDNSGWWTAVFNPLGQQWSLDAYSHVLSGVANKGGMLEALINTLVITIPATILPILIAANAAYAFTFLNFKGKEIYFSALVGLMVIPLQAALVPILNVMAWINKNWHIHIAGDYPAAWLVHTAFALPLAIYIFRNYMLTLPVALIEAARVDGASYYQIFWRMIMPMSVPALASFAIFQFLWVWNDYLIAFIFVGEQKPVMTYKINLLLGQYGDGWLNVTAASFLSLLIPLAVFFSLQRFFVRGLTAGSVK
ncbi:MAG: carbohydrate ABC transporter permease [Rhodoluna sp.]|nr:carbohydrate ABC transporter permease [Rhodoluna sp.]